MAQKISTQAGLAFYRRGAKNINNLAINFDYCDFVIIFKDTPQAKRTNKMLTHHQWHHIGAFAEKTAFYKTLFLKTCCYFRWMAYILPLFDHPNLARSLQVDERRMKAGKISLT